MESPLAGSATGYSDTAWPSVSTTLLTANYYDNYQNIPALPSIYNAPAGSAAATTGLLTASSSAVLNKLTDRLLKVFYYDDLRRTVKTYAQHYYNLTADSGNYDTYSNTYNFTNAVTTTPWQHYNDEGSPLTPVITIANAYRYDHLGRKTKTWENITRDTVTLPKTLISQLDYNELGQVLAKHLGRRDSTSFLVGHQLCL